MNQTKILTASIALGLALAGSAHAVGTPRNLGAVYGNFNSNAGNEVAIPYIAGIDTNADGIPNKVSISFKVYTAGTLTKRYSTQGIAFPVPTLPAGCGASPYWWYDFDLALIRRGNQLDKMAAFAAESKRLTLGFNYTLWCQNTSTYQTYSVDTGIVYNAWIGGDPSTTPAGQKAAWMKIYKGSWVEGLNGLDTDADLVDDVIAIGVGEPANLGGANLRTIVVDPATGNELSNVAYPIIR